MKLIELNFGSLTKVPHSQSARFFKIMVIKVLPLDAVAKILAQLSYHLPTDTGRHHSRRNRLLFFMMLDGGLRVREVVTLTWDCLYTEQTMNTAIKIHANCNHNSLARLIPMSSRLSQALHDYTNFPAPPLALLPLDYVFPAGNPHRHLTTRQVHRIIKNAGRIACNIDIHPHMLRHTFATLLMMYTPTRVVQELLGHKSLTSTQIYTHPNSTDLRKAIDGLNKEGVSS